MADIHEKKAPISWDDLPIELKVMCVDRMDFKTRTSLSCCSHSDRDAVHTAKKYSFERVEFGMSKATGKFGVRARYHPGYEVDVWFPMKSPTEVTAEIKARKNVSVADMFKRGVCDVLSEEDSFLSEFMDQLAVIMGNEEQLNVLPEFCENVVEFDRVFQCFLGILKNSIIKTLYLDFIETKEKDEEAVLSALTGFPPITIDHFQAHTGFQNKLTSRLLDLCDGTLRTVSLDGPMQEPRVVDYFTKPQIQNAKTVQLQCFNREFSTALNPWIYTLALNLLTDHWTRNHPEIGSKLLLGCDSPGIFHCFAQKFRKTLGVYYALNTRQEMVNEIRLPIDTQSDILLYMVDSTICCEVIPITLAQKNYVKNVDLIGSLFPYSGMSDEELERVEYINAGYK